MAEKTLSAPAPRPRRRWLRALIWVFAILILLVVGLYFVGTSSAFVKGVILPRVGKSIDSQVTVSEAKVSPFKEVVFKDFKVHPRNFEPLLTAKEVRARYHLMDILKGNLHIDEIAVVSPIISVVENADGKSNLDPILKSQESKPKGEGKPSEKKPSKPIQIDLKKLTITDATVQQIKQHKGGRRDLTELSHVNVTLDDLKNGQTGKLLLNADMAVDNNPPAGTSGVLHGKVTGNFVFSLDADLAPASVTGNTHLEVNRVEGAFAKFAALAADLDCEISPSEVKRLALRFQKGGAKLGEIRASGPLDTAKGEGKLKVEIVSIDKQVLNLAGQGSGLDFGPTTLNSSNEINLANRMAVIQVIGGIDLVNMQVTRGRQTTPPLDLKARYDVSVDTSQKSALLRLFNLNGTQNGKQLLLGELTSPMNLGWGNVSNALGDSALNLVLTGLNFADWKPFIGDVASEGVANFKMKLLSQQGGKQLTFDLDANVQNVKVALGEGKALQANMIATAKGKAMDLKRFELSEYKAQVTQQTHSLIEISGTGSYDTEKNTADLPLNLRANLAPTLQALADPQLTASGGTAELKARFTQKQDVQTVTGDLVLADFTGKFGDSQFRNFGVNADLHLNMTPQEIQFPKINGRVSEGGKPGGAFAISGSFDKVKQSALLNASLNDFNQEGLRPFLQPLLGDKLLVTVAVNGNLNTQYHPEADSTFKADLQVTNLVVSDASNAGASKPLEAKLRLDTSLQKKVAEVRELLIALTPTQLAKNELQLKGRVDMSQTNAYQGNINVAADSLDVTRYYDLFTGEQKPAPAKPAGSRKPTAPATPAPAAGDAKQEPEAITLPLRNFIADLKIGRLYLREVAISNLQTAVKIDGGHVLLNPCQLSLNGAPMNANADLDLGVPGYKYDCAFNMEHVPLAPLVNSFQPESKGQLGGTVTAVAKLKGAGVTDPSLQKNLAGEFDINTTNLNLSVEHIRKPWLKALINLVASIPDLAQNPAAGGVSLVQNLTGLGRGGLSEEMKKSPIDVIVAKGVIGKGEMQLQQAVVQSVLFRADATGTVKLEPVLTNSTLNIPVAISLSYPVAKRVGMVPADTPTNAPYARLPDFYTMKGTAGDPKPQINYLALAKGTGLGQKVGDLIGGKTGDLIGGLLGGPKPASTNASGLNTNQPPATNQLNNLLDLLKPKPKKN